MNEFLAQSTYFGVALSLCAYGIGCLVRRHVRSPLANPLLISAIIIVPVLLLLKVSYSDFNAGASLLNYLLTPCTICLAIPLYEQFELLRRNALAVLVGIASGVVIALTTIFVLSLLFGLDHTGYVTLLPKSVTTAIGIAVSSDLGGCSPITVVAISITGIGGNILAETILRLFGVTDRIAKGVAIGTASHAMGTAKAMEIGQVEGAMSSLSIAIAGILTVFGANIFSHFI